MEKQISRAVTDFEIALIKPEVTAAFLFHELQNALLHAQANCLRLVSMALAALISDRDKETAGGRSRALR